MSAAKGWKIIAAALLQLERLKHIRTESISMENFCFLAGISAPTPAFPNHREFSVLMQFHIFGGTLPQPFVAGTQVAILSHFFKKLRNPT